MNSGPRFAVRAGCAMLVLAIYMVIVSIIPVWWFVSIYYSAHGDLMVIDKYLRSEDAVKTVNYFLIFVSGTVLAIPVIGYGEAEDFLRWMRKRE